MFCPSEWKGRFRGRFQGPDENSGSDYSDENRADSDEKRVVYTGQVEGSCLFFLHAEGG